MTHLLLLALAPSAGPPAPTAAQVEFFESKVRPVLVEHCVRCHGPKKAMAGLRLDSAAGLTAGSDNGPVVKAGDPDASALVKAVRRQTEAPMPPTGELPVEAVASLAAWVKDGAAFPAADATVQRDTSKPHWAYQPVKEPKVPGGTHANPVDRFIAAKLAADGLTLSPEADKRTLLRRLAFDLVGLPPTAAEFAAFEADTAPDAYERAVERLLASPRYGERWARHWLDLARYSDTKGYVFQEDRSFPYAYTYRDYVIRALNDDTPYDQFVVEQIAADKLALGDDKRPLAAMGFLTLNRRFLNNQHDIIDDRIDVVTRTFMGLTVGCARCHDHKYDPIPIADYYSLYGVFASSVEPRELPQIGEVKRTAEFDKFQADHAKLEQTVADGRAARTAKRLNALGALGGPAAFGLRQERILDRADRDAITGLQKKADAFMAASPFAPPRAMVMNDRPTPVEPIVFVRGNPGNPGPRVPRQMPAAAAPGGRKPFTQGSGRLELARAIASKDNPLTARVLVNRVWAHHFGAGLVRTPSDFGVRADPPTHPELLDWLAAKFVGEDGWSLKKLHRRIVLSAAYRQSSLTSAELTKRDPENKTLARASRRRLDFEQLRDSMLAAAGTLDVSAVGGRPADLFKAPFPTRRTVYGFIDRQNLPGTFRAFDLASPDQHAPQRFQTTVPQQALFLMNSPFVAGAAKSLVSRPDVAAAKSPADAVRAVYLAALGRPPAAEEVDLGVGFLTADLVVKDDGPLPAFARYAQALLLSNEFAFVD